MEYIVYWNMMVISWPGPERDLTIIDETEKTISGSRNLPGVFKPMERSWDSPYLDFNGSAATITRSGQFWWGIVPGITILDEAVFRTDSVHKPGSGYRH